MARVYYDDQFVLERDNGQTVRFTYREWNAVFAAVFNGYIWDEVELRYDKDPRWDSICEYQQEIVYELSDTLFPTQDEASDIIARVIDTIVGGEPT